MSTIYSIIYHYDLSMALMFSATKKTDQVQKLTAKTNQLLNKLIESQS